jgi:hypothetical protein
LLYFRNPDEKEFFPSHNTYFHESDSALVNFDNEYLDKFKEVFENRKNINISLNLYNYVSFNISLKKIKIANLQRPKIE